MSSLEVSLRLSANPASSEQLGAWLGERLRCGDTLALVGELGAGKTTLVRGLAAGLRLDDPAAVSSPTYLLVVEHPGPKKLLHADAYLPAKLAGFLADGGLDYLADGSAVVAVEWADRIAEMLPTDALWLTLTVAADGGRQVLLRCTDADRYPFLAEMAKMNFSP